MNIIIQIFTLIFWFVVVLVPLVVIHEFGHFLMARLCGVKIPEFAVGFPLTRRLFYKRWKGTIWSFYPVLIGGFVRIEGDNDALDQAFDKIKDNPQEATDEYLENRFQEIMQNQELQFFLEDNHLEYDKRWKEFEASKFAKGEEDSTLSEEKKEQYQKMYKQVLTLIGWELENKIDSKNSFFNKNWFQQTLIIFGGVTFNFITAILIFWVMFTFINMPRMKTTLDTVNLIKPEVNFSYESEYPRVLAVSENSPAASSGLKTDDYLIKFDGKSTNDLKGFEEFRSWVDGAKGREIEIVYRPSDGQEQKTAKVKIEDKFGISPLYKEVEYKAKNMFSGMKLAWTRLTFTIKGMLKSLGDILLAAIPGDKDRSVLDSVAGPIAVSSVSSKVFEQVGILGILDVMALVSISLAVFNLLPIPALDGGRWLILTINKILGKRNRKLEAAVISFTFIGLLLLSLLIAVRDVQGIIQGKF